MRKMLFVLFVTMCCFIAVSGCNKKSKAETLRVGATPVPHAEILNLIKDDLKKSGVDLEIIEFTDYITPNIALDDGQIDANFFQHQPYLDTFVRDRGMKLVSLAGIHIEPLGLYSNKIKSITELQEGAVLAIPNDPTNEGRALLLLQSNGLIMLSDDAGLEGTPKNIVDNPQKILFRELDAAQLPRVLNDVDAAVINGNFAMEAKLNPMQDAIILEGADSPYVNIITVRTGAENDPRLQALANALKTEKVKQFIADKYNGGVVAVF
ncbi:MAG: MetQ/NlpA family ABC transporter substrate-binding protein [Deferribacteraceae bacterium]|jgi:D-methionine transport system substrate-binding protein|nr:MetQ/NlpA family ABC transporter substrate-binding protein [Deferribacteraceae bacterium]